MLENFIYSKQKSLFEDKLNNGEVLDEAIAFIEDTKEIWNHGTYFDCSSIDLTQYDEIEVIEIDDSVKSSHVAAGTFDRVLSAIDNNKLIIAKYASGRINQLVLLQKGGSVLVFTGNTHILTKTSSDYNKFVCQEVVQLFSADIVDYSKEEIGIPYKLSVLTNDSDFITTTAAKSYTDTAIANLIDSAPDTLNTLNELATAILEHQDVTDALDAAITNKADKTELPTKVSELENDEKYIKGLAFVIGGNGLMLNQHKYQSAYITADSTFTLPDDISSSTWPVTIKGLFGFDSNVHNISWPNDIKWVSRPSYYEPNSIYIYEISISPHNVYYGSIYKADDDQIANTSDVKPLKDKVSIIESNYVTTNTEQTISGKKTFSSQINTIAVNASVELKGRLITTIPGGSFNCMFNETKGTNVLMGDSSGLKIGYGSSSSGYDTIINGRNLYFNYGTNQTKAMMIYSNGTVAIEGYLGIGTATPEKKLHVVGSALITDDLTVNNNIEGDFVDWYGVSWSENNADPTCTRIGNMAMHRSLPILSAMKGYYIERYSGTTTQYSTILPVPLSNNWSTTNYSAHSNNGLSFAWADGSIFVKIPEFWYIDEYVSSTKTHNLKISQTAKAGWLHHKEAYVSAYEGYDNGTYYQSSKNKIPTVSVTRDVIRTKVRANGIDGESKWNIYTYEEHRAICHLFLVEYATRNCQAPVNSALTADGFRQGGLGSGCTAGTATINGTTTYSFIPTGTTDSLGNGSGQVAYTVTQTDDSGNTTGTITRYANRYRGIENPFGHVWKHCDDVISVYNSSTGYRTWYKSEDPSQFATNKNSSYKPICSRAVPANGYKKEIAATINCDFFAESTGGSESTYWCDYNYDNADASEHCLLIGSYSNDGSWAGLFSLASNNGVSASDVRIGSRLTYLPWAE